jgi:hypothetical protein
MLEAAKVVKTRGVRLKEKKSSEGGERGNRAVAPEKATLTSNVNKFLPIKFD